MDKKYIVTLALLICLSLAIPAFSEVLVLKSGKSVEGKYLRKTDKSIVVDIEGVPITYYFDEIETIDGVKTTEAHFLCPEGLYTKTPIVPPPYTGPMEAGTVGKAQDMPFYVYSDRGSAKNHFFPYGLMGDYGDIKYSYLSKENPYSGETCIEINYCACGFQYARWAGIYWQAPANNWGTVDAGYNLSKAAKLTFWARGAKGGENIEEFKVGGIMNEFSDSDRVSTGPLVLNKEWTQYTIDLKDKDMSYIIGGFCWIATPDANPDGIVFYLDEIKFE
ncbi:MAG: hypothetical protein K9L86_05320 [Candidatus Omnitrophica bacterium]|nr:hypothetical protein [Candidatus Omnitrophota bacterium]